MFPSGYSKERGRLILKEVHHSRAFHDTLFITGQTMKVFLIISSKSNENNITQTVERHESSWGAENPRFTYEEIRQMTKNFKCEICKGGIWAYLFG